MCILLSIQHLNQVYQMIIHTASKIRIIGWLTAEAVTGIHHGIF
jgi:hypothetical protein